MRNGIFIGHMLGQAISEDGERLYYTTGNDEKEVMDRMLLQEDVYTLKYPNGYKFITGDEFLKNSTFTIIT